MKRIAIILVVLLFTLACAPLNAARSTLDRVAALLSTATSTATANAEPTATATSASTTTTDPINKATFYSDNFSEDSGEWTAQDELDSRYFVSKGEYFIQAVKSEYGFYNISDETHTNFVMTVDLRHVVGDDETTGAMVLWRFADNNNYYAITVMDDGTYYIYRFLKGKFGMLKLPAASPWLNKGGKTNKVTLSVHDDAHELYFNDQYEYTLHDDTIPRGQFGMGALPSLDSEVEVAFDNLNVYQYNPGNGFTPDNPAVTPTPQYQTLSWKELTRFLADDHTNWHEYDLENYNCMDFAIDLVANAHYAAINAKIVTVMFVGQETGHAFVAFETSDRGIVFVEPQGDNTYSNVKEGNNLCDDWGEFECMGWIESIEYFGACDHAQNCTVLP